MTKIVIIGAGIGGLTAGALLAKRRYEVKIFDQAIVPGGCASTFSRRGFTFDVGATQVAGLEPGGIHHRIFQELNIDLPDASFCDPACAVFLPGENSPINVWHDRQKWQLEREKQFPGSGKFWHLLSLLFQASWKFQSRDPILPPRTFADLSSLISAVRLDTLITAPFYLLTVGDALRLFGLKDQRLKTFLDLQLKLYSQVNAEETALLYAATALAVSQTPQGLYHLQGSMQVLSDRLLEGLKKYGGELKMRHSVTKIETNSQKAIGVRVINQKTGESWTEKADQVVANVTVQNLVKLTDDRLMANYKRRVENLPESSGAFVIYLGVLESAVPENCPPHLQFFYDYQGPLGEMNSLFVSVSKPNDGRAPQGMRTIIASSFTDTKIWYNGTKEDYQQLKKHYTQRAIEGLNRYFNLTSETIIHQETATPRTFATFTARENGIVGGIGQRLSTFALSGFSPRTPLKNLWLVGDSTHPGEGTAGVSYSALTMIQQLTMDN